MKRSSKIEPIILVDTSSSTPTSMVMLPASHYPSSVVTVSPIKQGETTYKIPPQEWELNERLWELNERLSVIEDVIKKIEKDIEYMEKTSGYEQYIIVPINEVFLKNDKVKLSKTMSLIVQFENGQYIVSYNNLGLLAVNDYLDRAINEIQIEFSDLWSDYVLCPEEELSIEGITFKNKLKEYIINDGVQ